MRYEPFYVYVNSNGKELSGFGQNGENPMQCAKRLIFEKTGIRQDYVVGVCATERMSISQIDSAISAAWPKGALTIPVYRFKSN